MDVTLTLPQELQAHIEQEMQAGSYPSVMEYLIALVERDRQRKQAQKKLDELLQEGLDSPAQEIAPDYWKSLKASVIPSSAADAL